jgi:hypothetical protein
MILFSVREACFLRSDLAPDPLSSPKGAPFRRGEIQSRGDETIVEENEYSSQSRRDVTGFQKP